MASFSTVSRPGSRRRSWLVRGLLSARWRQHHPAVLRRHPAPVRLDPPARMIECDDAFWAARCDGRPPALEERQAAIQTAAMEECRKRLAPRSRCGRVRLRQPADSKFPGRRTRFRRRHSLLLPKRFGVPADTLGVPFASTYFRTVWPQGRVSTPPSPTSSAGLPPRCASA